MQLPRLFEVAVDRPAARRAPTRRGSRRTPTAAASPWSTRTPGRAPSRPRRGGPGRTPARACTRCSTVARIASACSCLPCSSSLRASFCQSCALDASASTSAALPACRSVEQAKSGCPVSDSMRIELPDRAGQRDVQRVDEELVDLERLVGLSLARAVVERRLARGRPPRHPAAISRELRALAGDEAVEDDVLVFEPLGLVDGEDQRRLEVPARPPACPRRASPAPRTASTGASSGSAPAWPRRVSRRAARPCPVAATASTRKLLSRSIEPKRRVLDPEQRVGDARRPPPVAVVGAQHLRARCRLREPSSRQNRRLHAASRRRSSGGRSGSSRRTAGTGRAASASRSTSASWTIVRSCTSSTTTKS